MKNRIKCLLCKKELEAVGGVGDFFDGVNGFCPNCQLFYKDEEAIAKQVKDRVIKI